MGVKHSQADEQGSGLLTITLLAYAFYKEQRDLTVDQVRSPAFLSYFSDVGGAVTQFGRSSGTYLENEVILKGPADASGLTKIASATGGQEYTGTPQNIQQVFVPISEFF